LEKQIVLEAWGGIDELFGYNGPAQMTTCLRHKAERSMAAILAAFDDVIREVRQDTVTSGELDQLKVKWRSDYYARLEDGGQYMPRYGLMNLLACFTLFDGEPQLVNTTLDGFLAVTRDELSSVANEYLRNENRAIVFRVPSRTRSEGSDLVTASSGVGN